MLLVLAAALVLLPPFVLEYPRAARATPVASGAEPAYPLNHTIDESIQSEGTPPSGQDFETDPYAVGTPPTNNDFSTAASDVGTLPSNPDFETASLSPWVTSGTVTLQSATGPGYYARFDTSGASVTSDPFTVDSTAQTISFDVGFLSTSGTSWVIATVLSGGSYGTSTQVGSYQCGSCGNWQTMYVDITAYQGQSIKVKFARGTGSQVSGIDALKMQIPFPGWTVSGLMSRQTEAGGNVFAGLDGNNSALISSAFTVDSSAQFMTAQVRGTSPNTDSYYIDVLSGGSYSTVTTVSYGNIGDTWQTARWNVSQWQGQSIKIKARRGINKIGVDDVGFMSIDVDGWDVTKDTRHETGGPTGDYVTTDGNLVSQSFTIPSGAQHLTVKAKDPGSSSIFYVELLRGPTFSTVTVLGGGPEYPPSSWKTYKYGVEIYAGETVKLRIRQYWQRGAFDDVGVMESVLPGWTLTTDAAVTTGEDTYGTYASGFDSSVYLKSSPISTGIVDTPYKVEQKFYAFTYQHMGATNAMVRVSWYNSSGSSWVVSTKISSTADGIKTAYFGVADFMGSTGYFKVQVTETARFYSIADNIARQQIQEPMSHKAGIGIDTSTGAFGFSDPDIQLQGRMPLNFRRFYTGNSDRLGPLGYRWSHSYDTRLSFADNNDVGVIFGSGGEEFFDGNGSWVFTPMDARVADELVKNGDGTFSFKTKLTFAYANDAEGNPTGVTEVGGGAATTTLDASGRLDGIGGTPQLTVNRTYNFSAGGVLTSIVDLNGNTITLAYDGSGRLSTVTDPDSRVLTLAYNGSGQLASVTAPDSAVVSYGYDGNGDLVSVTDPEGEIRTYAYSGHRITSASDQDGDLVFVNTNDSIGRAVAQADADSHAITIDYDTPSKGVTSVTDQLANTAEYYFDVYHRTTDKVDPLGRVLSYVYDTNGRLQKVIDPVNNQWQFAYDSSGGLSNLTDPLGNAMAVTYNALHLPSTITDANGNTTSMTYDSAGNLLTVTDPLGKVTTMTYDSAGNVLTRTNPLSQTETYTYDSAGNLGTRTDALGHTWTWAYDGWGRMISETNPLSQTRTWSYIDIGVTIATETDALGHSTTYGYAADGRLVLIQDELGNQTIWSYDDRGLATKKTDPGGYETHYAYDDKGRLTSETDPLSHSTAYTYDDLDRVLTVTDAAGGVTTYSYNTAGQVASVTDAVNRTTAYTYDLAGRLLTTTLPNTGVWSYTYDDNGNLTVETDPLSNSTTYLYDANSRLTRETDALLRRTNYGYDDAGRMTTTTDALSQVTTRAYDAAGRLTSIQSPLGGTTSFGYDNADRLISTTDPMSRTSTSTYDATGRLATTADPLSNTTTYAYDDVNRLLSITRPSGALTSFSYNSRGLRVTSTDPLSHVTTYAYDAAGRLTGETDPLGRTTSYGYDAANRQTSMTDALSGSVTFGYNLAGERTSVTNPNSQTTTYTYDSLGSEASVTDRLSRTSSSSYDLKGQLSQTTDARGTALTFSYDAAGQMTGLAYPGGTVAYVYDAIGRRTSMTDVTGLTTTAYDADSRVTSNVSPQGTVSYAYNAAGDRLTMTQPGSKTVTYAYDGVGRLQSVTDWLSQATNFSYDVDSNRTGISRANGVTSTYAFDAAARVTSIAHAVGGTPIESFTYNYDNADNRTSLVSSAGTESYTVDALNRLTGVTYPNGDVVSYTYDAAGNRLTQTVNGVPRTYTYDAAGQMTSDGTSTYTYDADGNLVSRGTDTFTWDYDGRMTGATIGAVTSSYSYDADGTRIGKTVGAVATTFVWDRESGLPLMIDDGSERTVYADGGYVARVGGSGSQFALGDALGSTRLETNGSGTVSSTASYDVFGAGRTSTGIPGALGFTGEYFDQESGWTFLRTRSLDPVVGRFPSVDPVVPGGPGSNGWNLYAYVTNAPTRYVDPTGQNASQFASGIVVGVIVGPPLQALGSALAGLFTALSCYFSEWCRALVFTVQSAAGGGGSNGGGGGGGGGGSEGGKADGPFLPEAPFPGAVAPNGGKYYEPCKGAAGGSAEKCWGLHTLEDGRKVLGFKDANGDVWQRDRSKPREPVPGTEGEVPRPTMPYEWDVQDASGHGHTNVAPQPQVGTKEPGSKTH